MGTGKLVVFEGIYGSGKLVVEVVNRVRETLVGKGSGVYEIDSPDTGRARIMGAQELDTSWRYGVFEADFFFELASRARVASVVREELSRGKIVLCKNFTLASAVHARLLGHDWDGEELGVLERRARGMPFGREVVPDLTIFVDVRPELAAKQLGDRLSAFFPPGTLERQRELYLQELHRLPPDRVKRIAAGSEEGVFEESLAAIRPLVSWTPSA
jgi:thymidylate kinase